MDAIARHVAKLQGHADEPGLERLLSESPNAYMTAYDLLYKTATAYFTANNAFILIDRVDSHIRALYPLSPASVEFVGASGGDLYARLIFADGRQGAFALWRSDSPAQALCHKRLLGATTRRCIH